MNRLQEYLKTPNPVNPQFFFPLTCRQEDVYDPLFSQNLASNTKQMDSPSFQPIPISSTVKIESQRTPLISQSSQYNSKMIYQKIKFQQDSEEHIETPLQKRQNTTNATTTAQKKYGLRTNLPNPIRISDGKQSQRSLRVLTSQAYEVVCHKGSTTYKIVSQEIINETCDQLSAKEQNNIKRRVYDALNVLIALGKLQKKGRRILLSQNCQKQKINKIKIKQLQQTLTQKQHLLNQKRKTHKKFIKKHQNLKKLISRNHKNNTNINMKIINLPFMIIKCQTKDLIFNHQNPNFLKINQPSKNIYHDLDSLNLMKFNHKS